MNHGGRLQRDAPANDKPLLVIPHAVEPTYLRPERHTLSCTHIKINKEGCCALVFLYATTKASSRTTCGYGRQLKQQSTQCAYLVGRPSRPMAVRTLDSLSCDLLSRLGALYMAHRFEAEWPHAIRAAPVQIAQGPRSEPEAPRGAFCLRYGRPSELSLLARACGPGAIRTAQFSVLAADIMLHTAALGFPPSAWNAWGIRLACKSQYKCLRENILMCPSTWP